MSAPKLREDKYDEIAEAHGMEHHVTSPNQYGGLHHTVYNEMVRISWDDDKDGNYVLGSHHSRTWDNKTEFSDDQ